MLSKVYLVLGAIILAGFAFVTLTGRELGDPEKQRMPPDVRQSPGGYRSYHIWYSGFRGGK
jgi:hypothetical protein